jgi:FkbM family methyltransferase
MGRSDFATFLPGDAALTLVDVGSAGGLQRRWRPYASILSAVLFDPREAVASGALGRGQRRVYPVALGREAGQATLNVLALPNMSSTLEPNRQLLGGFRKKGAHSEIVSTEPLTVETLDEIAARDGFRPDVLKIDTQGSELEIIEGARRVLSESVLMAEVEVSFLERYRGQPLCDDVLRHMRGQGFDLIELSRLKRYRAANTLGIANIGLGQGQRAGRLAYGDAIFLRSEPDLLERGRADRGVSILRAVLGLLAYGKPDMAARLLDQGRDLVDADIRQRLATHLSGLKRSPIGWRHLHVGLDWLARKV